MSAAGDAVEPLPTLREVDPGEVEDLSIVLATALSETPMSKAMFPDPELRMRFLTEIYEERLRAASSKAASSPLVTRDPSAFPDESLAMIPGTKGTYVLGNNFHGTRALTDGRWSVIVFSRGDVQAEQFSEQLRFNRMVRSAHRAVGSNAFPEVRSALEEIGSQLQGAELVTISALGTEPERRGHGLARAILSEVIALCDVCGLDAVGSFSQPELRPFYESFGFKQVGLIPGSDHVPETWLLRRESRKH